MMTYQIRLISRAEREAKIQASSEASTQTQDFYDFRDEKTSLKVIRLGIDVPVYRVENFRTFIDQHDFIRREGKSLAFFSLGQENESVQQVQHEILARLAETGRDGSIVPIIDVLRQEKQREALLITHSGVVVNGNRRLAAMRELYKPERNECLAFSHVNVMVLPPDALPEEIVDIEARLQGKPETKLEYDWVGDCELINKLLSLNRTPAQIAKCLHRKEKEIRNSLQALAEADMYLKDWLGAEAEYSKVRDAEQFFKDLPEQLKGKDSELEEASRVIAWTLFDNKESLGDRIYSFNVAIGKRAADVLDRVSEDLGISLDVPVADGTESEFDVSIDSDESISYQPIINALKGGDQREEVIQALIESARGVVESERSQKSGTAALKAVTAAHAKLSEVDIARASPETHSALLRQLEAIFKKSSDLRDKLLLYSSQSSTN